MLEYLISKLNAENQYTEKEINAFIKQYHDDFCTIRREFIVQGFMDREDNMYRINGREMWTKWEELKIKSSVMENRAFYYLFGCKILKS